jgi:hypothetical protein
VILSVCLYCYIKDETAFVPKHHVEKAYRGRGDKLVKRHTKVDSFTLRLLRTLENILRHHFDRRPGGAHYHPIPTPARNRLLILRVSDDAVSPSEVI